MNNKKLLTRDEVVRVWLYRGIEDFFFAFKNDGSFVRYSPFFNYMGLELVSKSYLLGCRSKEYENEPYQNGLHKVNAIAKNFSHEIGNIISEIQRKKPSGKIGALLSRNFDGSSGAAFVKTLESVYLECRYPVPEPVYRRFPVPGKKKMYMDPVGSSGLPKFCYALSIEVMGYIRDDFSIKVHQSFLERLRPKTTYRRFRNLFFGEQRHSLIERK
jgi:hypothetical protein